MSYAIARDENVPAAIRRVVAERIDRAAAQLTDESLPIDERVHGARKRFKEIRAVLRLAREALGATFAIENAWYRDAARDLSAARDADALVEAIDKLLAAADDPRLRRALARAKRILSKEAAAPPSVELALQQLAIAKTRIDEWPPIADAFGTIGAGLRRTYRDGRRAMRTAIAIPSDEHFHDWRKRVKDHWYHAQLLREVWPPMMKPYLEVMEQLSRTLGDDHDLALLRARLASPQIREAIDARRAELSEEAISIGRRVYADAPRAVERRFGAWWNGWRR
ncbi:MAG TPA: CHAD domain-containing protein [Thermoanaerobaculia bacterium]|nr:CHAD domain-containing protein [Thermoanaerobaculia bacterium]